MALSGTYAKATIGYGTPQNPNQVNVLWYRPTVSIPVAAIQAFADALAIAIDGSIGVAYKGWLAADASYFNTNVILNIGGVVATAFTNASTGVGSISGVTSPEANAAVIRKHTEQAGKTGRGRWFIGCVPESMTTIGFLSSTGLANLDSLGEELLDDQTASLVDFGSYMYSKKDDALYKITDIIARSRVQTQRRRIVRLP